MTIERILVADESCEALEKLASQLTAHGYDVFLDSNSEELLQITATDTCDMAIININLSGGEGLESAQSVATRSPDLFIAVMGDPDSLNSHSHELLAAKFTTLQDPVTTGQLLLAVQQAAEVQRLREENQMLRAQWEETEGPEDFVAHSPRMVDTLRQAATVADAAEPVLICGPPGSETELVARYIHRCGHRADNVFVRFECGRSHPAAEEVELFGREYHGPNGGTWLGSGRLELANGGTLFLENITALSPNCQAKLLRFIEEGCFLCSGADRNDVPFEPEAAGLSPRRADVRIICSSIYSPQEAGRLEAFRDDLLYRLHSLSVVIPPLAERPEDIIPLAERFLHRSAVETSKGIYGISEEARRLIEGYNWPGNVEELKGSLRAAVAAAQHKVLLPEDLLQGPSRNIVSSATSRHERRRSPREARDGTGSRASIARMQAEEEN